MREEQTARAEAHIHSVGLFAGDKSPAYRTNEFFRSLLRPALAAARCAPR